MRVLLLLFIFFWGWLDQEADTSKVTMVEICDNGIDDDMDGLIDLNDTADCFCNGLSDTIFRPTSLIPNPSFEDTLCCPQQLADLECANDWIQASWATSDFFHTCGFTSDPARGTPPQPLPSGDAYVGFLDVSEVFGIGAYKEYVGACLTESMTAGQNYTLKFYLGFGTPGRSYAATSPMEIVLFGTNSCAELPFGQGLYASCPSTLDEWFEIGSVVLTGRDEWVEASINFNAPSAVEAVAIGPGCTRSDRDSYYFLDDLLLNRSEEFEAVHIGMQGDVCDDQVTLTSRLIPDVNYQWYKDGIAIVGENSENLLITSNEPGDYIVRIDNGIDCELSQPFEYYPSFYSRRIDTSICQGQTIVVEGEQISGSFYKEYSYNSQTYCDSTIIVDVVLRDTSFVRIDSSICASQSVEIAGDVYDQTGNYRVVLSNQAGCDSVIYLNLSVQDTVNRILDTIICEGGSFMFKGTMYDREGEHIQFEKNTDGCDIRWTIRVEMSEASEEYRDTVLCSGQSLWVGGDRVFAAGRYPLELKTAYGCDSSIIYDVSLRDTFAVQVDTTFCLGDGIQLEGLLINNDTSFQVRKASQKFCDSVITYRVVGYDYHEKFIDTFICEQDILVFKGDTLTTSGTFDVSASSPNGCDSLWHVNLSIRQSPVTRIDTHLCFDETFIYEGLIISSDFDETFSYPAFNGCDSLVHLAITFEEKPFLQIDILQPIQCFESGDGHVAIDGVQPGQTLIWGDGYIGEERKNLDTGQYSVTLVTENDCQTSIEFELTQPQALSLDVVARNIRCGETTSGEIVVQEMEGGTGQLRLRVNGEQAIVSDNRVTNLTAGVYEVELVDQNECSVMEVVEISEIRPGSIDIQASAESVIVGDSVDLYLAMEGVGGLNAIDWFGPDGDCLGCDDWRVYPPKGRSRYDVYVTDEEGCQYEDFVILEAVSEYFVPNVFSPNGDEINDFFTLFSDRSIQEIVTFRVYDRWGELVHLSASVQPGHAQGAWDGYLDGRLLNPGVYVYVMEVMDKDGNREMVSGDVTLLH